MKRLGNSIVIIFAVVGVLASIQRLRGQSATPFEGATVMHVGIIVKDVDKTLQMFSEVFGIPAPKPTTAGPLTLPPNRSEGHVKFATVNVGSLAIELLEPVDGATPHKEFLDRFGQGLHHLAFQVKDAPAVVQLLESKGGKYTMGGANHRGGYVDMKDQLGFTVELSMPRPPQ